MGEKKKGKFTSKVPEPPIELTVCSLNNPSPNEVTASSAKAESNHLIDNSAETSSTDTGTTSRMDNGGSKVPVLAVGTYHRKEAAPILAAAARLDLSATPTTSSTQPISTLTKDKNKVVFAILAACLVVVVVQVVCRCTSVSNYERIIAVGTEVADDAIVIGVVQKLPFGLVLDAAVL
ncbi:hypothetical protein B9Z55_010255 [Caenorhabditis nigoni]|uniref:Uncharacterized protein n=1 Tax=Caenorhabditis nigoni TaxID=1611254 RepID=A0A2G5UF20_9PELO|nr:hypothetical protein B9Z55_010255 [Caenorhabditis nigoni]